MRMWATRGTLSMLGLTLSLFHLPRMERLDFVFRKFIQRNLCGKTYDGQQIDMFSTGVILFIIVQGIFPFKEAKKDEYFYNLIINGKLDQY